jgi:predicted GTPase
MLQIKKREEYIIMQETKKRIIIIGAAGRDFHNFNTYYRDNSAYNVVAFTAAQIPDIAGRKYPASLAGELYPNGIPIHDQKDLGKLIKDLEVDVCVFAYSDVPYSHVMNISALVNAAGATFALLGHKETMIKSTKPVIAVGSIRTGCGKGSTSHRIIEILSKAGLKVISIRHPMPYGDLEEQKVQRFAKLEDLETHKCTIEEMEEYEPHIKRGNVIYAGVDYEAILRAAENDPNGCDVILWDGGNNDFPFYKPDLMFSVVDPTRPGHELAYYPGEVVLRIADVVIINKLDSAKEEDVQKVRDNIALVNPSATVISANSLLTVENPDLITGKRVLAVEDGPTLTHGEAKFGAGVIAAQRLKATEIVDPRSSAVGKLAETFKIYPHVEGLLPAMGYGKEQMRDLEATINKVDCDAVVIATPTDLSRIIKINKPCTRVEYELQEIGSPNVEDTMADFIKKAKEEKAKAANGDTP